VDLGEVKLGERGEWVMVEGCLSRRA
jgi:hypothetical protein